MWCSLHFGRVIIYFFFVIVWCCSGLFTLAQKNNNNNRMNAWLAPKSVKNKHLNAFAYAAMKSITFILHRHTHTHILLLSRKVSHIFMLLHWKKRTIKIQTNKRWNSNLFMFDFLFFYQWIANTVIKLVYWERCKHNLHHFWNRHLDWK